MLYSIKTVVKEASVDTFRVKNPNGATVFRRNGTELVREEGFKVEFDTVISTTGITFKVPGSTESYYEYVPQTQQDSYGEYYISSNDLDLNPTILLP